VKPSYGPLAEFLKALADENRLKIIAAIGQEEKSVSQIIAATGLPQSLVSHHLRQLRQSRIVQTRRAGPFVYYRLTNPILLEVLEACTQFIGEEIKRESEGWVMPCWCPSIGKRNTQGGRG